MKYIIITLLVFYVVYRLAKTILGVLASHKSSGSKFQSPRSKYKNVEEADYIEIKSEKKEND